VVIVVLTLIGAVFYEILQRREAAAQKASEAVARGETATRAQQAALYADPAVIVALLIFIAGFGTVYFAGTLGVDECKVAVKTEKRRQSAPSSVKASRCSKARHPVRIPAHQHRSHRKSAPKARKATGASSHPAI
jgi:hypothetical protein